MDQTGDGTAKARQASEGGQPLEQESSDATPTHGRPPVGLTRGLAELAAREGYAVYVVSVRDAKENTCDAWYCGEPMEVGDVRVLLRPVPKKGDDLQVITGEDLKKAFEMLKDVPYEESALVVSPSQAAALRARGYARFMGKIFLPWQGPVDPTMVSMYSEELAQLEDMEHRQKTGEQVWGYRCESCGNAFFRKERGFMRCPCSRHGHMLECSREWVARVLELKKQCRCVLTSVRLHFVDDDDRLPHRNHDKGCPAEGMWV